MQLSYGVVGGPTGTWKWRVSTCSDPAVAVHVGAWGPQVLKPTDLIESLWHAQVAPLPNNTGSQHCVQRPSSAFLHFLLLSHPPQADRRIPRAPWLRSPPRRSRSSANATTRPSITSWSMPTVLSNARRASLGSPGAFFRSPAIMFLQHCHRLRNRIDASTYRCRRGNASSSKPPIRLMTRRQPAWSMPISRMNQRLRIRNVQRVLCHPLPVHASVQVQEQRCA